MSDQKTREETIRALRQMLAQGNLSRAESDRVTQDLQQAEADLAQLQATSRLHTAAR